MGQYVLKYSGEEIEQKLDAIDGEVTTDRIVDEAVTNVKIANTAVTTDKIADTAVTPAKLDRTYFETGTKIILKSDIHYGDSLPAAGTTGQLFFKKV